jgi:D-arabinose 1-dehydrogenase-like Zn-dependent alcohol dehydrogenase
MKTKAAVLWGLNQKWEVEEVDLDGPKEAEALVKLTASGLCHSDHHLVTGDPADAVAGRRRGTRAPVWSSTSDQVSPRSPRVTQSY